MANKSGFPQGPQVTTTRGLKDYRPPLCWNCRERRPGVFYHTDPNGNPVCDVCEASKWKKEKNG